MRKRPITLTGGLVIAAAGLLGLQHPLPAQTTFLDEDTDSFDPGLSIGSPFPPIRALYQGGEITGVDPFMADKGMVFIANRSADW